MSVSERIKNYNEKFEFNEVEKYYLEKYCELQEQYDNTSNEHVKTKKELLDMMIKLHREIRWKVKTEYHDYKILVVGNDYFELDKFKRFLKDNLSNIDNSRIKNLDDPDIETKNGKQFYFYLKSLRGVSPQFKVNEYINLTGDKEFEENVLKKLIK